MQKIECLDVKNTMDGFDIPVALFLFRRMKAVEIVKRLALVKPRKLYLLADQGRNDQEIAEAKACREAVEQAITWDCQVVRHYAGENRGVYGNIAGGAKWVLRQERWAIFLEDDNLPEETFFPFCKEMLERYEDDTRILWICGTNYLGDYQSPDGASYVFTRHMLPCGWASWSGKFERFYDGELKLCENETVMSRVGKVYYNKAVYEQYRSSWMSEYRRIQSGAGPRSWDYQMDLTIKAHNLFGICPCRNQIKNIGVDGYSVHGGTSYGIEMAKRFCGMDSYPLEFPLRHPATVLQDDCFERKIAKIILYPLKNRIIRRLSHMIRRVLPVPADKRLGAYLKDGFK